MVDKNFCFYGKSQNSSLLTMSIVKIGHILPKRKNTPPNFLYVVQYMANYHKINRKLKKYWGKIHSFLPWTQILKWTLRPLFCTQVKSSCVLQYIFIRSFDFGTKQELCPKKFMPGFGPSQKSAFLILDNQEIWLRQNLYLLGHFRGFFAKYLPLV